MNRQRGFTLIELLIVVALLLVITAIAIPRFLRARIAANEASAAASVKQIGIANAAYSSLYNLGYAGKLKELGPPPGDGCAMVGALCADLVDSLLSGVNPIADEPVKSGYQFTYSGENDPPRDSLPNNTFSVVATPSDPQSTGVSTFCFDNQISIFRDTSGGLLTAGFEGCSATWPVGGSVGPL